MLNIDKLKECMDRLLVIDDKIVTEAANKLLTQVNESLNNDNVTDWHILNVTDEHPNPHITIMVKSKDALYTNDVMLDAIRVKLEEMIKQVLLENSLDYDVGVKTYHKDRSKLCDVWVTISHKIAKSNVQEK